VTVEWSVARPESFELAGPVINANAPADRGIDPNLSVLLDVLRFTAALTVLIGHASGTWLTGGYLWQLGAGLRPAVIVFFVLSGYVIAATLGPSPAAASYGASRLSRLYSVVLPALALTFILDSAGSAIRPDFYAEAARITRGEANVTDGVFGRYLLSGLFLQKWWIFPTLHANPGTNGPFWSLSYEAAYYIAFAILVFMRARARILALITLFLLAGPAIFALWPLWLLGAVIWHARPQSSARWGWVLMATAFFGFVAFFIFSQEARRLDAFISPMVGETLISDYWIGLCTAALVLGFSAISKTLGRFGRVTAAPVRFVADHTFEVYLLHIPLVYFSAAVSPYPVGSPMRAVFVYAVTLSGIFAIARMTTPLRRVLRSALSSFRRSPATAV
jgi:peptidoglycan/LPS O-acetylase OafA/YrhL